MTPSTRMAAAIGCLVFALPAAGQPTPEQASLQLESNLRWMLQRERDRALLLRAAKKDLPRERVGVFADAGVWHVGAKSVVTLLEANEIPCRVLDRSLLNEKGLEGLEAIVLPGGWAPSQWAAAGDTGLAAIRKFVEKGGRCLGICAGAYLLARTVKYDDKEYPYPLGLFDGVARGPVSGLAEYPKPGSAKLSVTEAGKKRGLVAIESEAFYYSGGPCFEKGTAVTVLARYAKGDAAAIARRLGKGEVVLVGAHLERPAPPKGDDAPAPKQSARLFRALLFPAD